MTPAPASLGSYTGGVELRRLKYFVVLAHELHFGRASETLRIAQPGLSQQIQVLETELNVRLFERSRRGVALTSIGRALLPEAEDLLRHAERFQAAAAAMSSGHGGTLRIAHNRSTPELGTAKLLGEFRAAFPEIEIEVESGWTAHNCSLLRQGDADAVFVRLPLADSEGLDFLPIGTSEMLLAMAASHRLAALTRIPLAEVAEEPVVMWPRRQSPGYYDHLFATIWGESPPVIVAEEPDASYVLAAVKAGMGVAILDRTRAEILAPPGVELRQFEEPVPLVGYGLAWSETDHPTPALDQFIQFAKGWVSRR